MIIPVILCGGAGTRLWPLSRKNYPKQFLPLLSENQTLFQAALIRANKISEKNSLIICNQDNRFLAAEQIKTLGIDWAEILLEPVSRNTGPAITLASLKVLSEEKISDAILVVMPADHFIENDIEFEKSIKSGIEVARTGKIVCFGVPPIRPETGYGYIKKGNKLQNSKDETYEIAKFTEKPDKHIASQYIDSGDFYWNSGIFIVKASVFINEMNKHEPELVLACQLGIDNAVRDLDFIRIDADSFAQSKNISVDYAIMECTDKAVMIPMSSGWNDVGSWSALWQLKKESQNGNVCVGDIITDEATNSYLHSTSRLIAAVGINDLVVVETKDAVLVSSKDKVQNVKNIVNKLIEENRNEQHSHREVYRPWGKYDSVDIGERYQVKRITVKPREKLSVQMHHHRAEHWIVVRGTAKVTIGKKTVLLSENQSTYIPLGEVHALENPGVIPLEIIEVQSGSYLGEDDIIRFEDRYGRLET
ncbi:mannose-1-phosphate guanylyltransferase/mannose-6-phosphate isomerase [uncultured Thalassospira sp.]|uniref:mannose-1-phosphate guanylyltransferase/mannose-6-phosphate isomerase n=1 Tax=uncultured Thalassospira sp. TaxID=404382 RepID=UPI0030D9CBE3|tara:strand:+ start:9389 stop:10819 length:1431 start_codon:yes stop_codon:yes gene_type:complete